MAKTTLKKIIGLFVTPNPKMPKPAWRWYVFGGNATAGEVLMIVEIPFQVPLWRRVITRILLGSKWERTYKF